MVSLRAGLGAVSLAASAWVAVGAASAADLVAITDQREIIYFSDADPARAVRRGLHGTGGWMVGFDVRPADGMIYGLTSEGALLSVNAATGVATFRAILSVPLDRAQGYLVDFNPAADRLRVVGAGGQNLRINVDTGATIVDGPIRSAAGGPAPGVMAGAYTNSVRGASSTQLYVFDAATGGYALQNPPNDGVLQPVAPLGMVVDAADIVSDGSRNAGFLVSANVLYAFDPATGQARQIGPIGGGVIGKVIDIAVLPPRP